MKLYNQTTHTTKTRLFLGICGAVLVSLALYFSPVREKNDRTETFGDKYSLMETHRVNDNLFAVKFSTVSNAPLAQRQLEMYLTENGITDEAIVDIYHNGHEIVLMLRVRG